MRLPTIALLLAILAGTLLGAAVAEYEHLTQTEGAFIPVDPAAIGEQYKLAINVLINCPHLRVKWPLAAPQLKELISAVGISFYYDPKMPYDYYAFASPPDAIVFGPAFMAEDKFMQEQIIAHEMLHLAGLPVHVIPPGGGRPDFINDSIYKAIRFCYAGVSP